MVLEGLAGGAGCRGSSRHRRSERREGESEYIRKQKVRFGHLLFLSITTECLKHLPILLLYYLSYITQDTVATWWRDAWMCESMPKRIIAKHCIRVLMTLTRTEISGNYESARSYIDLKECIYLQL